MEENVAFTREDYERLLSENEALRNNLYGNAMDAQTALAERELFLLLIRRLRKGKTKEWFKGIVLQCLMDVYQNDKYAFWEFDNMLEGVKKDLDLRCHEWDSYLADYMRGRYV